VVSRGLVREAVRLLLRSDPRGSLPSRGSLSNVRNKNNFSFPFLYPLCFVFVFLPFFPSPVNLICCCESQGGSLFFGQNRTTAQQLYCIEFYHYTTNLFFEKAKFFLLLIWVSHNGPFILVVEFKKVSYVNDVSLAPLLTS
jgi:hypothetical protein